MSDSDSGIKREEPVMKLPPYREPMKYDESWRTVRAERDYNDSMQKWREEEEKVNYRHDMEKLYNERKAKLDNEITPHLRQKEEVDPNKGQSTGGKRKSRRVRKNKSKRKSRKGKARKNRRKTNRRR